MSSCKEVIWLYDIFKIIRQTRVLQRISGLHPITLHTQTNLNRLLTYFRPKFRKKTLKCYKIVRSNYTWVHRFYAHSPVQFNGKPQNASACWCGSRAAIECS
jgi:hypothetical protein